MNKKIVRSFNFRSSSSASIIYQTLLYSDGSASCNCPGWARRVGKDGVRTCKHIISAGLTPVSASTPSQSTKPDASDLKIAQRTKRAFDFD